MIIRIKILGVTQKSLIAYGLIWSVVMQYYYAFLVLLLCIIKYRVYSCESIKQYCSGSLVLSDKSKIQQHSPSWFMNKRISETSIKCQHALANTRLHQYVVERELAIILCVENHQHTVTERGNIPCVSVVYLSEHRGGWFGNKMSCTVCL